MITKLPPKMPAKTRRALEASIAHWKRHATGKAKKGEDIWSDDCALCGLFNYGTTIGCYGCPVAKATGKSDCEGSPWERAEGEYAHFLYSPDQSRAFRRAAARELAFLRSLHPDKKVRDLKAKDVKP